MFPAAYQMASPPSHYSREWRDGGGATGRNYGDQLAEVSVRNTATSATAATLHKDERYRPSGLTNRTLHAHTYTLSRLSAMTVAGLIEPQLVVGFAEGFRRLGSEDNSYSRHEAIW
jgi:hypothetical protein